MDPHVFNPDSGTNEREPIGTTGSNSHVHPAFRPALAAIAPKRAAPPGPDECNVCELRHAIGTEHPERIHLGPRTVRVTLAVAIYMDKTEPRTMWLHSAYVPRLESRARRMNEVLQVGARCGEVLGSAFIEADIPLIETPTVQGSVQPVRALENGGKT